MVVKFKPAGNVYLGGLFPSTVDFDPGPASFNLTAQGFEDAFVLKLDASGNFIWAKSCLNSSAKSIFCTVILKEACEHKNLQNFLQQMPNF